MSKGKKGFTGFLLKVVKISAITVITCFIILIVAVPSFDCPMRSYANRSRAHSSLLNLWSSQDMLKQVCAVDLDHNNDGEYGYFKELAGMGFRDLTGRQTSIALDVPMLARSYSCVDEGGVLLRGGYLFRIFLPDDKRAGVPEGKSDYGSTVCPKWAEKYWCCYAWPCEAGGHNAVFFIDQTCNVFCFDNKNRRYSADGDAPEWNAAYPAGVKMMSSFDSKEASYAGNDGETWKRFELYDFSPSSMPDQSK